jgi:hypothetical protein
MTEHPILFSGEMIRAILAGTKVQTRRVAKFPGLNPVELAETKSFHQDGGGNWIGWSYDAPDLAEATIKLYPTATGFKCPYGKVGDTLWFRETWATPFSSAKPSNLDPERFRGKIIYRADITPGDSRDSHYDWRPSIFMPRWASRISRVITNIRLERLQDISEEDARAEGVHHTSQGYRYSYCMLWNEINSARGYPWAQNDWVFVLEFEAGK